MNDGDGEDELGTNPPPVEDETEALPKELPASEELFSPVEELVTQAYMQKAALFLFIMLVVLVIVKRRRSPAHKSDDKSMA
ncbi:hypothetical protein FOPE_04515 [Fonsecaea pedrosoi]|nr:hypothetical protein FOPE_04515 [Fonsecaea pedrosoi]